MAESQPTTSRSQREDTKKTTETVVVDREEIQDVSPPVLHLRLQQPNNENKVKWSTDTVDNEFMGKKKSKCCCIYHKPKVFGERDTSSSSDSDDENCTAHCRGHKKKCYQHKASSSHHNNSNDRQCDLAKGPSGCTDDDDYVESEKVERSPSL